MEITLLTTQRFFCKTGLSDGRIIAVQKTEESPGSSETRYRITSGQGDLTESATEKRPPFVEKVRVKR